MKGNGIVLSVIALAVGAAAGYFVRAARSTEAEGNATTAEVSGRPIEDLGESASVKALRARVAELERRLAEKAREDKPEAVPVSGGGERAVSPRERMARLEKEDPARYAQITNRIANWRRRRAESAQAKIDFLASIDTSRMSKKERAVHEELQELVARREELESSMHNRDLDDDQRLRIFEELRSSGSRLRELAARERDSLLSETARNLGFEGEDVGEIVSTVKEIFEATDSGWGHRAFGPRPGGRVPGARRQ
jgi:hypothetical protein